MKTDEGRRHFLAKAGWLGLGAVLAPVASACGASGLEATISEPQREVVPAGFTYREEPLVSIGSSQVHYYGESPSLEEFEAQLYRTALDSPVEEAWLAIRYPAGNVRWYEFGTEENCDSVVNDRDALFAILSAGVPESSELFLYHNHPSFDRNSFYPPSSSDFGVLLLRTLEMRAQGYFLNTSDKIITNHGTYTLSMHTELIDQLGEDAFVDGFLQEHGETACLEAWGVTRRHISREAGARYATLMSSPYVSVTFEAR